MTITLDAGECRFLITVLKASGTMMNALIALERSLPEAVELPITANAVTDVMALAERIEQQIYTSR